jgi:hypothetical protein
LGFDSSVPAGVVILTFIDDQGSEARPGFSECRVAGDSEDETGELDFVKGADVFRGAAGCRQGGWLAREGTELKEEFLPTADHDLAAFELAEGDDPAELGGKRLVVGQEKNAPAVALARMTKGEFEGVPGFAGPGAAVDEELAVPGKLVEQGEAGGELAFEELFGVVDEGTFFLG